MEIQSIQVALPEIQHLRDIYRQEMHCQIVHDSLHSRSGWAQEYILKHGDISVGYGSVLVGGPWSGSATVFEYYLIPAYRHHLFTAFESLLSGARPVAIRAQTNDPFLSVMIHAYGIEVHSEKILFEDVDTTDLQIGQAGVRAIVPEDKERLQANGLDADAGYLLEVNQDIVAAGGILYHYNRPYGDVYMAVAEPHRRKGNGSYLVQELKRICYQGGSVPAARCNPDNIASRQTLLRAGFRPCGHILEARLP